jgi:hypothetical protein
MDNRPPTPFMPRFQRYMDDRPPTPFVPRFQLQYHADLTNQACPENSTIKANLQAIVAANLATDLNQYESALHFDNCTFELGVERISNLWELIESNEQGNRYNAFGTMIHTVQDFYAHSNWIELHENQVPVPVWNLDLNSLPPDILSGTFELDNPKKCGPNAPTHTQLNKDSPNSDQGRKTVPSGPNQGKTLFDLAFATALHATKAQFVRLETVIGLNSSDVP